MAAVRTSRRHFGNLVFLCRHKVCFPKFSRCASSQNSCGLIYSKYGDPAQMLQLESISTPEVCDDMVKVEMLASPINPADINQIQGTYPIKPSLPAVGGNEGVGKVVQVGDKVNHLKLGDLVIPVDIGHGCWKTHWLLRENELCKVSSDMPLAMAATMSVNPPTAYRMLKDFVNLQEGDTVIQNGANSGVGQSVIQVAAAWGLKTVNIIRDRPNLDELVEDLKSLGATHVITEDVSKGPKMREFWNNVPKPKLALNCVGGKSSTELLRHLSHGGVMVTYGGMSRQPIVVPTSALIFKDVALRGFWMSRWKDEHGGADSARAAMMDSLCKMASEGKLKPPPCDFHPLSKYKTAVEEAMASYVSRKQIFVPDGQS